MRWHGGTAEKGPRRDTAAWHGLPPSNVTRLLMCCLDVGTDSWVTSKLPFVSVRNWPGPPLAMVG